MGSDAYFNEIVDDQAAFPVGILNNNFERKIKLSDNGATLETLPLKLGFYERLAEGIEEDPAELKTIETNMHALALEFITRLNHSEELKERQENKIEGIKIISDYMITDARLAGVYITAELTYSPPVAGC
ncbi:hypothetical protein FGB62_679g03 [Gracilaria domingensis]|nr:hypothetical protein FGB62_679g03 [Gracilaria domingensis]